MRKFILLTLILMAYMTADSNCQFSTNEQLTKVQIRTDSGTITIVLYDETPLHRDNFIKLTKSGYFDNQLFHRLIKNFMIQGGDPNSKNADKGELLGQGGPSYTIPAEFNPNYFHKKGALAAARKGDDVNPSKASSGSQFYIVQGNVYSLAQLDMMVTRNMHAPFTDAEKEAYTQIGGSPHLDGSYTVFGEVIEGFEVLDKLMRVPVDAYDRPLTDLKFSIKIFNLD